MNKKKISNIATPIGPSLAGLQAELRNIGLRYTWNLLDSCQNTQFFLQNFGRRERNVTGRKDSIQQSSANSEKVIKLSNCLIRKRSAAEAEEKTNIRSGSGTDAVAQLWHYCRTAPGDNHASGCICSRSSRKYTNIL